MRNCIEYVLQQDKTDERLVYVTGPYSYDEVNYDLVYQTFLEEKRLWGKDSGRMYAHNIISWHKDEKITPNQALEFGKAFAEKWFSGFQTLISIHRDKEHIHCHLVTNSVSYENGKKLHNSRKDLERMKQLTNQMCREQGLSVAEKGRHFDGSEIEKGEVIAWSKDKYNLFRNETKESYVADCAMVVLAAMEECKSKDEFINKMKEAGWNVNWSEKRKHIVFQNQKGKKVRDSNLSKTFHLDISKEALESEFIRNEEKDRDTTGRNSGTDDELSRYYRQVEDAVAGAGKDYRKLDEGTGQASGRTEKGTGIVDEVLRQDSGIQEQESEDVIRKSKLARRTAQGNRRTPEIANRVVRNAENQSIFTEEQRRSEE
jgi:hypothetical protein